MIWVLPGFLGQASDFDVLSPYKYQVISLFEKNSALKLKKNKQNWTEDFISHVQSQNQKKNILLGYSFGARLGLEVVKSHKNLFDKCILISANALNLSQTERVKRADRDKQWAQAFKTMSWDQVLHEWNSQSVLKNSNSVPRKKQDYDLEALELALTEYSLAQQFFSPEDFKGVRGELLWLFGEEDSKFVKISKNMQAHNWPGRFRLISQAGHRLHFDNSQAFLDTIGEFLANKKEML